MKVSKYEVTMQMENAYGERRIVVETVEAWPAKSYILPQVGEAVHYGAMEYRAAFHGEVVSVECVAGCEIRSDC
jgi:hypothetical protein